MAIFGLLSALLFNISGLLAMRKTIKQGHARDMMAMFLYPWVGGSATGLVYAIGLEEWPLICNFGLGVLFGSIIIWYKLFPRN